MGRSWIVAAALFIVVTIAIALAFRPHFLPQPAKPHPAASPKRPDVAVLKSLAIRSCNCERASHGKSEKDSCWKSFNAAIKPWQRGDEGFMMCGDPTEQSIELTTGETIVTRYVSERGAEFCTVDEARIGQAAYDKAERIREHDPKAPSGDDVLDRLAAEFARGQRVQVAVREAGCTSG